MTTEQFNKAMRYVVHAHLVDAMQGQDAFYYLELNCGHILRVSPKFLSASMLCTECVKKAKA